LAAKHDSAVLISSVTVTKSRFRVLFLTRSVDLFVRACVVINSVIMAALWYRAGHNIFALCFLSSSIFFFHSPNLSGRILDVYHTSTHGVALVRI